MGKKHLKQQNPESTINLIDLVAKFDPTKTNKFTPFLYKILVNSIENVGVPGEIGLFGESLITKIIKEEKNPIMRYFIYDIYDRFIGQSNMDTINQFAEYLDKGLIEKNDISTYTSINEMVMELNKAITKDLLNKSKNDIQICYEDDEWMFLKPLSYAAALKYGNGTKWCTSSKSDPGYFYRYSKNGVLIYVFNKKNNRKYGTTCDFESISFWDETDKRIDSFEMKMGIEPLTKLFELLDNTKNPPNFSLFSEEEKKRSETDMFLKEPFPMDINVPLRMEETDENPMRVEYMPTEEPILDTYVTRNITIRNLVQETLNRTDLRFDSEEIFDDLP